MSPEYYRALVNDILAVAGRSRFHDDFVAPPPPPPAPPVSVTVTVVIGGQPVEAQVDVAKSHAEGR